MRRKTTAEYLDRARALHKGKYDYSLVTEITTNKQYIPIICPEHGVFQQQVSCHVNAKQGCPKCSGNVRKTKEEILAKAREVHGNKYHYPHFEPRSTKQMIEIHCPDHGPFPQEIKAHLSGVGCPRCAPNPKTDTVSFIEKARAKHGDKYDYSRVNYVRVDSHVIITCPEHGDYKQTPHAHLSGYGCSRCVANSSKQENAWLDSLGIPRENRQYKIKIGKRRFTVDGFDPATNTVYEFYGDYFHGNPCFYDSVWTNRLSHRSFGELYTKTLDKEVVLRKAGYKIVSIWEDDWAIQQGKKARKKLLPTERYVNRLRYLREWEMADDDYVDNQLQELAKVSYRTV